MIFETATPFDTPRRMESLVSWLNSTIADSKHHILLIVAVFVVRFLAIHPFQDGNGRLSRALTTLLLLRARYGYVPYSSLERIVEENKDNYYKTLRSAQSTLDGDESRLIDWLTFFIDAMCRQKQTLKRKVEKENLMSSLPALSEQLYAIVREHGRLTVRDAVKISGANRNTVKSHLARLVTSGHLVKRGQGRGTWYEKS